VSSTRRLASPKGGRGKGSFRPLRDLTLDPLGLEGRSSGLLAMSTASIVVPRRPLLFRVITTEYWSYSGRSITLTSGTATTAPCRRQEITFQVRDARAITAPARAIPRATQSAATALRLHARHALPRVLIASLSGQVIISGQALLPEGTYCRLRHGRQQTVG